MHLRDYLEQRKIKQTDFAEKAGLSDSTLSRVLRGETRVMPDVALKIYEAANHEVPLESILKMYGGDTRAA